MNQELDDLAFRFFKLFARYEATLKELGYFSMNNGRIEVDWDRFTKEEIGARYRENLGAKAESAEFILNQPPMKQVVNDEHQIIWQEVSNQDKSPQALFGHIRRMRNNLFHGAKFKGTWFDPDRSRTLLEHGLVILEHYWDRLGVHDA